jgi:site-specific DNA-methyltransferase (adenine-specific)
MEEKVIDIQELAQDQHNFNKGNEQGQQLMERSFKELGAGRSILLDKNGNIIAGNKSQKAAIAAGIKKVRVIETTGDELVAVKRTDVDIDSAEGRKMAYLDNLSTQVNLTWDQTELEAVQADVEGFDIADFGVDLGFPTADPDEADKVTEDDFDPDEHYEPTSKAGDIFQLGDHRLMCGDSTKDEDVARLMNGEQADLWLTDPPYNCGYGVEENKTREQQDHHKPIENDKMDDAEYQQFLLNVFKCASDNMREGAAYYIWYSDKEHSKYQLALSQLGIPYKAMLIWNKNTFVLSFNDYKQKHEVCLYGWKPGVKHYFVDKRNLTSVYEDFEELDIDKMKKSEMQKLLHDIFDNPTPTTVINEKKPVRSEAHPTMKPVRLFGYQIANSSRPGNIILDTFGGSGTTAIACEQLGRKARLMELDPHYCDVIIARWEKLTGQKAIKLNQ